MEDPREASDENLMTRYADGDAAAFDELFKRYEARIYAFFHRRTASEDRAGDLYQDFFLRLHRARSAYDPSRPLAPWVFQIANRLWIDDVRRAFRTREVPLVEAATAALEADADQRVADAQRAERALDRLSGEEQRVLLSAKVEGVGYAELGRELGKSVAAVKKLASRAMQRLRAEAELASPGVAWARSAHPTRSARESVRPF